MQLIGIAGTAGAGKDAVADMLCRLYNAENFSSGDVVRAIARHLFRLPPDAMPARDQLFSVATFLREIDPAFTVKMCIEQAKILHIERVLITGLRATGEADAICGQGGTIVGVDADPKVRYERIFSRQRGSEAQETFETFVAQDTHENAGVASKGPLRGIQAIIDTADIHIENGSTLEALEAQVRERIGSLFDTGA